MHLRIGSELLDVFPDDFDNWTRPFVLAEWKGFECENSLEEATGENIHLVLYGEEGSSPEVTGARAYQSALDWVIQNSPLIREAALEAIFLYIRDTLIDDYGLDDPELLRIKKKGMLMKEIDPSYLRLFPHSRDGVPYFALEFECSWDPEHGCGVMFWGNNVLEVGVSDTAQGGFDIAGHGGKI